MELGRTLQDYDIGEEATVHLVLHPINMPAAFSFEDPAMFINIMLNGREVRIPVTVNETITGLKACIQDEVGIPPGEKHKL